jgi:hypothetical protein
MPAGLTDDEEEGGGEEDSVRFVEASVRLRLDDGGDGMASNERLGMEAAGESWEGDAEAESLLEDIEL